MSPQDDDDDKTRFGQTPFAGQPSKAVEDDDDATIPPQPLPEADAEAAAEEDDDKTQFMSMPVPPLAPEATSEDAPEVEDDDDDKTQFVSQPAASVEPSDTIDEAPAPEPDASDLADEPEQAEVVEEPIAEPVKEVVSDVPETSVPPTPAPTPDAEPDVEEDVEQEPAVSQAEALGAAAVAAAAAAVVTETPKTNAPEATEEPQPVARPKTVTTSASKQVNTGKALMIGTRINNNYEIQQVLKAGGMGEVYRGIEIGTGDPVAIKAILPELAEDEKAGLMFKREARTLRQLADDAIVRYYNYVHDIALDRYFLVMEFISGVPLSDFVQANGAITADAGRTLLKRLARGLHKAHAQDVVHRDLSPDNVMLPDGIVGEAVLIDFGIAKSNVVKESTMAGQFAGKFKYVAPEQLGHYNGEIGPRTDIYGLALLVCAAVIGKPLDMGSSIVEAVDSRRTIPDLSDAPEELRPLLSHMLEPDPADRPATMLDVARMAESPERVPEAYGGGGVTGTYTGSLPPQNMTTTPGNVPVFGLQTPGATTTAGSLPPQNYQTQRTTGPMTIEREEATGGKGILFGLIALFALILGGAGIYGYSTGLFGQTSDVADVEETTEDDVQAGIPAPDPNTREGFLATLDTGPCTLATRISAGQNAGMVAGFSASGNTFAGLPTAYEETFGARPEILVREVSQDQCAALDFVKELQGRGRSPVRMRFNTDVLFSGEAVTGQITTAGDENVWTVLISSFGGVFNLTGRLSDPVGNQRSISFGLNLNEGAEPQTQLLLTVASEKPLTHAAAMRDGAKAEEILANVLQEISGNGGTATADISYLVLQPAPTPSSEEEGETE